MTAFNVVRMRAKPGRTEDYLDAFKVISRDRFPGMQALTVVRTGERDFCVIGAWDDMAPLVAARPQMQATLDGMRDMFEDLGGSLGVTDPVSGEALIEAHR